MILSISVICRTFLTFPIKDALQLSMSHVKTRCTSSRFCSFQIPAAIIPWEVFSAIFLWHFTDRAEKNQAVIKYGVSHYCQSGRGENYPRSQKSILRPDTGTKWWSNEKK